MLLSKHTVSRKKTQSLRAVREMSQRLAVSLAIRLTVVSKKVVKISRVMSMSNECNSGLRIESQIANSILQRRLEKYNTYLRAEIIHGRYIFFAVASLTV